MTSVVSARPSLFGAPLPIVQAPMAGVSTPALAAAVSAAGGLGGLAIGHVDAATGARWIAEVRARTSRPFVVNVFCHAAPARDAAVEDAWRAALSPVFARFGAAPPPLSEPYRALDDEALAMLLAVRPPIVSFHFGLPSAAAIAALAAAGIALIGTATSPAEARAIEAAGLDAIIAQGIEAGGHRGVFDPDGPHARQDTQLGLCILTRTLVKTSTLPIIAAGGIMDGAGIAAMLALGAVAAQLGTAFIGCPESSASPDHRAALATGETRMTSILSGRPARALLHPLSAVALPRDVPAYPLTYSVTKALAAAAKAAGDGTFGVWMAGQGAPLARALPAAELVATLARELS